MPPAVERFDKVKVAVRVRPLNRREIEMKTPVIIDMKDNHTYLYPNVAAFQKGDEKNAAVKSFAFDESFWTIDPSDTRYAGQEEVFEKLGLDVMENAFNGYNACILAYGQTGSGKSYTMLGAPNQPGIIPRLCNSLFEEISRKESTILNYKVEVSYMEIYNEKVHDLLDVQGLSVMHDSNQRKSLRVREHNILGPYVDGLSQLMVSSLADIEKLMNEGNKSRTVASTNMNSESSRSHAVFNIILTETLIDELSSVTGEKKAKISLVDLAGSERAQKTGAVGDRLREGCNINKSLTTLMLVISALADASSMTAKKSKSASKQAGFVPYRDSVLTWLLKDNLGGNSKTIMIATLSPAADNYEETLSTLRYADRAKRIVNHAIVNEDPNAKIIRELREQVEGLKQELESAKEKHAPDLQEKLEESENIIKQLSKTWEEKLVETERKHKERHEALEKMGISVQTSGIKVETSKFYLVNLNADPSLNELLVYYLKEITYVGRGSSQDIQLHGLGIQEKHCIMEVIDQEVYVTPLENARTLLNGIKIEDKAKVHNKDRILWGMNHFFRINCPMKMNIQESDITSSLDDVSKSEEYQKAQEEVMMAELKNDPIQQVICDLEKHHNADKEEALAKQKQDFERKLEELKEQMTSSVILERFDESTMPRTPSINNLMSMSQFSGSMMNLPPAYGGYAAAAAAAVSNSQNSTDFNLSTTNLSPRTAAGLWPSSVPMPSWMGSQANIFAMPNNSQLVQTRYQSWVQDREQSLAQMLTKLREQLSKANSLTREANFLADEMAKATEYSVTLQIPSASLNPNGKKGGIISEPAILVKRDSKTNQIWSLEKLENKIVEMKELYEEWKDSSCPNRMPLGNPFNQPASIQNGEEFRDDPFFDAQEDHNLIGVANIYLSCLFQKIKFKYQVPIINQQGEISGKIAIELSVVKGELPDIGARECNTMMTSIYSQSQTQTSMTSSIMSNSIMATSSQVNDHGNNQMVSSGDNLEDFGGPSRSPSGYSIGSSVTIRVRIIQATYLPEHLSHFVFCQYHFWGENDVTIVPPALQPDYVQRNTDKTTFKFGHTAEFNVMLTDDLLEHFAEDALSVEVFGNRNPGFDAERLYDRNMSSNDKKPVESSKKVNADSVQDEKQNEGRNICRKFGDRWMELYRRLEFWVCVEELNEQGAYQKVELTPSSQASYTEEATGGVFQLRHGQTRRVRVFVRPNKMSRGCRGSLPLICDKIGEISIGDIFTVRKIQDKCPDSYQEDDLNRLRESWSRAVCKRQEHLNEQLQKLVIVENKTLTEDEREKSLMAQWMRLTEERDAVLVPAPGSGIPGAPATWSPVEGMERHCPVIFLDIKNEEINSAGAAALNDLGPVPCGMDDLGNVTVMAGGNCLLMGTPTEANFLVLPIIKRYESLCGAVAQWDSSLHDSIFLNRITQSGDKVYLTVKVVVRLTHPALVDLVLRKRICINIYKKQGFTSYLKKQWTRYIADDSLRSVWSGVTYQIVSGIPQNSLDIEDRESLAQLAASQTEKSVSSGDQESYIEKYIRSVSAVESLLQLDRIRQEVACQEMVALMRKQRRSVVQGMNSENMKRGPIIGNPNVVPSPVVGYGEIIPSSNAAALKKYISVPDFQGMYRSSSLTNLARTLSPDSNDVKFSCNAREEMDYEQSSKSGSIANLTKTDCKNKSSVSIKSPLIPKRPQPPKNLLNRPGLLKLRPYRWSMIVIGKGSALSPLMSVNNNTQQAQIYNSKTEQKAMNSLKEEIQRQEMLAEQHSYLLNDNNEECNSDNYYAEDKDKLNRSLTEDSLTRSKSSGYGSSMTVSSMRHGVINNNNNLEEADTETICGTPSVNESPKSAKETKPKNISSNIKIGCRVMTESGSGETVSGIVRYLNTTQFAEGIWVGLELDEKKGNHNGTVNGICYFSCEQSHGVFTRPENVFT